VGSSNALNFEINALESPQYNMHRFGIYMTDSPRHADVLLILGRPTKAMLQPLQETITQLPNPFCIVTIDDCPEDLSLSAYPALPNHAAELKGVPDPAQILGLLLDLSKPKRNRS
jgi:Ni,Fe-hydrogenase III small subunit